MVRKAEKKRLKEIDEAKKLKKRKKEYYFYKKINSRTGKKIEQQKRLLETEKKIDEIKKMIESNSSTKVSQNLNVINKKKTESFQTPAPAPRAKTKPNSSNPSSGLGNPFSSGLSPFFLEESEVC